MSPCMTKGLQMSSKRKQNLYEKFLKHITLKNLQDLKEAVRKDQK